MGQVEHHMQIKILWNHRCFGFWTWVYENISKEALLKGSPKYQAKTPSHSRVCVEGGKQSYALPLRTKG